MPSLTESLDRNLAVNDGPLTAENAAFLRPSDPNLPLEELRARYEEDGYLFAKQVLPRADVLEMRHQYFSHLASTGVLEEGTQPVEGVFNTKKLAEARLETNRYRKGAPSKNVSTHTSIEKSCL